MLKPKFSIKAIVSIIGVFAIALLVFLSVLGVNNSVYNNMRSYFSIISSNNYAKALEFYSQNSLISGKEFNDSMKFHFTLELALLEYFDLLNSQSYKVEIDRENMWYPLFTPNELKVSVSFQKQDNSSYLASFFSSKKHKKLNSFLTVVREDGKWKIKTVNITGSDLEDIYNKIQNSFEADKYVKITQKGFTLNKSEINLQQITPIEKRVLIHNLKTALETIENN